MPASIIQLYDDGWYIKRTEDDHKVTFGIYDGEYAWDDGTPRSIIAVELWPPTDRTPQNATTIHWPSTSDKRPRLALALSAALEWAAIEADAVASEPIRVEEGSNKVLKIPDICPECGHAIPHTTGNYCPTCGEEL